MTVARWCCFQQVSRRRLSQIITIGPLAGTNNARVFQIPPVWQVGFIFKHKTIISILNPRVNYRSGVQIFYALLDLKMQTELQQRAKKQTLKAFLYFVLSL